MAMRLSEQTRVKEPSLPRQENQCQPELRKSQIGRLGLREAERTQHTVVTAVTDPHTQCQCQQNAQECGRLITHTQEPAGTHPCSSQGLKSQKPPCTVLERKTLVKRAGRKENVTEENIQGLDWLEFICYLYSPVGLERKITEVIENKEATVSWQISL